MLGQDGGLVFAEEEEDEVVQGFSPDRGTVKHDEESGDGEHGADPDNSDAEDDEEGGFKDMDDNDELDYDSEPTGPDYACRYCGICDTSGVVRCIESGFWFCNSSGTTSASHIVHHLVRSKNKEICLHPMSPLGETIVECYRCENRNVFTMGFIPAKGEDLVVLLCRSCLGIGALKDLGWNLDSWTPIIQDRQLVPWLVKVPDSEEDVAAANAITTAQINKLEDMWKENPVADMTDLGQPGVDDEAEHVRATYENGFEFQRIFGPLVQLEADYDREMKGQMKEDNVTLKWKTSEISGRVSALLHFTAAMSETLRITIGDELKLSLSKHLFTEPDSKEYLLSQIIEADANNKQSKKGRRPPIAPQSGKRKKDWECTGTVVHIDDDGEICLELRTKENVPFHVENGFSVLFVWKPITFDRMQGALKRFATVDSSLSGYLYHKLLGHEVDEQTLNVEMPARFSVKGLPDLNESQAEAIRQVLSKPLALIQGPPGTGKTVTSASLIYHMVKQNKGEQVLVCAPSNVAVDQLTEKLHQAGLKVVRLAAKSREHLDSSIEHLTLHHIIQNLGGATSVQLKKLLQKKEESGNQLSNTDMKKLNRLRRQLEQQVLKAADVICVTCSGAGDPRLASNTFKRVLLDEATQATEPESLIPIVKGCKQFVLVGDHCQLGPVVMCKRAANAGLNSSLFERLVCLGLRPIRLTIQYRMHPCLSEFPSNTFYEGSLQNGVSEKERIKESVDFPWPNLQKPMMFLSCTGSEELSSSGTSFLNRTEASNCERIVTALLRGGVVPSQIGVVTPYEGQRQYIMQHLQRHGPLKLHLYRDIEVSSVDAFQGREKDYIILSCVRSNEKQGIGFLNDPRRLNVALTRAKYGLVVLGNPRVLAKRPLWSTLLQHFQLQDLLCEGSLSNLQVSLMKFPRTKKYYRDRRQRILEERSATVFSGDASNPYGDSKPKFQEPDFDSRHDPRYGGESHIRQVSAHQFLQGPQIPMPQINVPHASNEFQFPPLHSQATQPTIPRFKGYGDFDYAMPQTQLGSQAPDTQGMQFTQHAAYTQDFQTQGAHPLTQVGGLMPSQSQSILTQQQSQLHSQSQSQYHFQDEDE